MAINEEGKVYFTEEEQAEVDRVIRDRVARVKSELPEDYEDLKEIASTLEAFDYKGTIAEKKAAIKAYAEETKRQNELTELQNEADNYDGGKIPPEILADMKELKRELAEIKRERESKLKAEKEATAKEVDWNNQVAAFSEKYPDVSIDELAKNSRFMKFVKGRNVGLLENYDDFLEFASESEKQTIAKIQSNSSRSTSSGKSKGTAEGGTYGLTDKQQEIAADAGISNKRYSELLGLIKK